jgi:hypothetical protein
MSSDTPHLQASGPGILLALAWLYFVAWGDWMAVAAFGPDAGRWELGEWLMTGAVLVPIILIPLYLIHCVRQRQPPRLRDWLPWVARMMYISLILAMCDCWAAGTERRTPIFSSTIWGMSDGGTRGYVGFGYFLTYYRRMGGVQGPEVWFWFTPFTVSATTEHVGLHWLWQH